MSGLLMSLPAAVAYLAGPELVFEFANNEYRRIVGGRELDGLPLREALPELAPERLAMVERTAATGEAAWGQESELWIRRHGSEPEQMFVDFAYQPVPDDSGGVAGVLLYGKDVTEHVRNRRRLEELTERLTASEERYRTLFETLPQGVVYYGADGSIIGANPAAADILGLNREGMTTWPIDRESRAVHEDGSPLAADELPVRVALRTGKVVSDVVVGIPHGRTGELRWLRVNAVPDARDERGRAQRAYAMFADVTEQRRAEEALRQSNRLLGRLRDANVVGVAVLTENGVQEANDAYLDIIGYTRDDLEAGRIHFRAITPPEWRAGDDDALDQLRRTGAARPWEKEYVHRDGHRVPVLIGAAMLERHPLRWASFVVDLTARQRREHERALLLAREQAARREAETARRRLAFLLKAGDLVEPAEDGGRLLTQVQQLVEEAAAGDGHGRPAGEVPEPRRAHQALQAINAELEERVSRRTSELLRAERERRTLEDELRQVERLQTVGQLTSGIAHDFGNLLAVIVGYAEMAQDLDAGRDPELQRILDEVRSAADRAVHLSGDLIRFSRRARPRPEEIDLNALLEGMCDLLNVSMGGHASVNLRPSTAALPAVRADRAQLEQVLLNLAVNARDAMPDGGTLTIGTTAAEFGPEGTARHPGVRPGWYVQISVQDTGVGMSPQVRERIFDRFFTTKSAGAGTGLGLFTVQGIIASAGGAIEVDSREGKGTTFRIYLPAVSSPAPAEKHAAIRRSSGRSG